MSDGILPVSTTEPRYRNINVNVPLVKKCAPHYAVAKEIVKARMKSSKQIEEQAYDYSITATKLRNKYLNELFDYVADVHKAEVKNGKKHHSVSNYDVLELYQKINGYNEKEFTRMLRAKKPDGSRMYSFKEINAMLDDSIVEHYRTLREKQAASTVARKQKPAQVNSVPIHPNSENVEFSTGVIPRDRALVIIRKPENPPVETQKINLSKILESAHRVMFPEENNVISFTDIKPIEVPTVPPIGISEAEIANVPDDAVKEILTEAEEAIGNSKKVPNIIDKAVEVAETIEETINDAGTKSRRLGKGWTWAIITSVAIITGLIIHHNKKKKAQNLNVNA